MLKKILKKINTLLVGISLSTMILSPVAMGKESERLSKKQAESIIQELGLNKPMTLNEFYKKNKYIFPARVQEEMEILVKKFGNEKMPSIEVATSQGKDGEVIPVLRLSSGNQLMNIQVTSDSKQFAKVDNVSLMAEDIVNFDDMFLRLYNGDDKYRKSSTKPVMATAVATKKFEGYPTIDKTTWKKMSQKERAMYILNMRQVLNDSRKVLQLLNKNQKTSQTNNSESFFAKLFLVNAYAEELDVNGDVKVTKDAGTTAPESDTDCVVAGYISKYVNGVCSHKEAKKYYTEGRYNEQVNKKVVEAQKDCSSAQLACNPYIYGTPNGKAICVTISKTGDFQKATHADGPCDKASPLGNLPAKEFIKKDLRNKDRYSADNLTMTAEELEAEYKKQQSDNDKYVENYLKGMLVGDVDFGKALNDDVIGQLVNIKSVFDDEIRRAKESCIAAANTPGKKHEKNFYQACDQLQRRFLHIATYLEKQPGCPDGGKVDALTLRCSCSSGAQANPGAKCSVAPPVVVTPTPGTSDTSTPVNPGDSKACELGGTYCVKGTCTVTGDNGAGAEQKECRLPNKTEDGAKTGGSFWSKVGGFLKAAAPWLLGGVVLFAIYKLWSPKKPSKKSAADYCPNGTIPPCGVSCPAPQVVLGSVCGCAACPPGQTLSNNSSCSCTTTSSVSIVTCADGVTQVSDISLCPVSANYTCWNGTVVTNPINCPVQPVTKPTGVGTDR